MTWGGWVTIGGYRIRTCRGNLGCLSITSFEPLPGKPGNWKCRPSVFRIIGPDDLTHSKKPGQSLMILTLLLGPNPPNPLGFCRDTFRPPAGTGTSLLVGSALCAKKSPTNVQSTCESCFSQCY